MIEFVKDILTSPFLTIGTIAVLWVILYNIFIKFKLSDTNWKRLEYIWIFTGLFGLLSAINENDKSNKIKEIKYIKHEIQMDISRLKILLSHQFTCFKYNNTDSSNPNIEQKQYDQDQICNWAKTFKLPIDTATNIPSVYLDTASIKSITFKTTIKNEYVKDFVECAEKINLNIDKYKEFTKEIYSNFWTNFSKKYGLLFLILAFAIRLSMATRTVAISKKQQ